LAFADNVLCAQCRFLRFAARNRALFAGFFDLPRSGFARPPYGVDQQNNDRQNYGSDDGRCGQIWTNSTLHGAANLNRDNAKRVMFLTFSGTVAENQRMR
jgi:hypothetical protein